MGIDRVVALASAGKTEEARALAREIREHEIPDLEKATGSRSDDAKLSLADAVVVEKCDLALALDILANDVTPSMNEQIATLTESLNAPKLDMETWRVQTEPMRDRLRWYVSSSMALLFATRDGELQDAAARAALTGTSRAWIRQIAFRELEPGESPLSRYAVVGRLLEATSDPNEVLARIESAPLPADPNVDHAARGDGPKQLARDLSFIRISPSFWSSELAALFAKDKKELDHARVAALGQRASRARDEARSLGLDHRSFEHELRELRLVTALVAGDEPKLRAELHDIKLENDRRVRMNAASWIATRGALPDRPAVLARGRDLARGGRLQADVVLDRVERRARWRDRPRAPRRAHGGAGVPRRPRVRRGVSVHAAALQRPASCR